MSSTAHSDEVFSEFGFSDLVMAEGRLYYNDNSVFLSKDSLARLTGIMLSMQFH